MEINFMDTHDHGNDEIDYVVSVTFFDERSEVEEPYISVPYQDGEFKDVLALDVANNEITLSGNEENQILNYVKNSVKL